SPPSQIAAELSAECRLKGLKSLRQRDVRAALRLINTNRKSCRLRLSVELPRFPIWRNIGQFDHIPAFLTPQALQQYSSSCGGVLCQESKAVGMNVGR